jgi:hypothetical protein
MSRTVKNTAFKSKIDDTTDAIRLSEKTEHGALLRTESGIWAHHDNTHVKLYPQVGSKGGVYESVETITTGRTLTTDDHVIFTNFSSEQTVTLPLASGNKGKEFIVRARTNSSKCVLSRSGSNKIDDGGLENTIDINADKSRTLISDGNSTWYVVTSTGA